MNNLTFRKLEHAYAGTFNGKPFNVPKSEFTLEFLTEFQNKGITQEEFDDFIKSARKIIIAGSNKYLHFNPITKKYYLHFEGVTSKHAIPNSLVTYIEESYDKDIDFMPVIKAWVHLLNNPRYNDDMGVFFDKYLTSTYVDHQEINRLMEEEEYSYEEAKNLATYQDISITQEGLLATYKVAELVTWKYEMVLNEETGEYEKKLNKKYAPIPDKLDPVTGEVIEKGGFEKPEHLEDYQFTPAVYKNGDKFFSGANLGYVYEVGKMQYLPEDARRNLANTFGGGGLYTGGLNYIESYRSPENHVLMCFVNPMDILSFQSEGQAIRTDALFPYNVWDETIPLKGSYHSADYGKVSTARVEELIKQALEKEAKSKQ